jgi:phage gp29-like protein
MMAAQTAHIGAIASILGGRDISRGFVDAMPILPSQDPILRARGAGNLAIYDEVLRDDMVKTAMQQRTLALTATEWRVEPGQDGRAERKAADFLQNMLLNMDMDSVTEKMLYGLFYGYAVAECIWAASGANVVLEAIKVRKQRRFGFAPDGSLRLMTTTNPMGEVVPERKFWSFRCGADNDDEYYGLGLAHWLYWPTFFKRNGIRSWVAFLDKFGQPSLIGKYSTAATEEQKTTLLRAIAALQSQSGTIIPDDMLIELLEASQSGHADFKELPDMMDRAIARLILTQTMTSSDGSSLSQAQVHERMLNRVVRADGNLIASSFNRTVAAWVTDWNFPGVMPPRLVFMTDEPDDLDKRAVREKTIFETTGLVPTQKHVENVYGGEWEVKAVAPTQPPAPPPAPPAPGTQFAEGGGLSGQNAVDAIPAPDQQLQEIAALLVKPILERMKEGIAPEELLNLLGEAYPEMDYQGLTDLLDRLAFAGNAWGRLDASNG